jgi:polysaccharide biosynthesis/export protein ExoF
MIASRSVKIISFLLATVAVGAVCPDGAAPFVGRAFADDNVLPSGPDQNCASNAPLQTTAEDLDEARYDPSTIGRGDKVKLSFYEVLEPLDDKWGADRQRLQEPTKGIQLRVELSKEYLVKEDGAISIPILGAFAVEGLHATEVQKNLGEAFDKFLGRKGFVDIVNVAKQPVYVTGRVKTSGAFDYTPGMTVLHAVALAGGFDIPAIEPWQVAEITREAEHQQLALDRAVRMVARASAINDLKTSETATVPAELAELAGKEKAAGIVSEEFLPRRLAMQSRVADEKSLKAAVDSAAWDLNLRQGRMPLLDQAIALRQDRLVGLSKLAQSGTLGKPILIQAQSELLDVQDRRQETLMSIDVAKDRLNKAMQDLQASQAQADIAQQKDLLEAKSEAAKAKAEGESSVRLMKTMTKTVLASAAAQEPDFEIVRRAKCNVSIIHASETTLLEPGDLVQAKTISSKANAETASEAN